jgi:Mg2+-importing ATPase
VAVGLTPEMLPMIVTVCLSKGALAMSKERVIVKHLTAIQNLGAMDVLCTDKTGTLTVDRVMLERYCDVVLEDDPHVLELAYLNSHFQTGLKNVLDRAILSHVEVHETKNVGGYEKVDEIPFDFERRIMSVVVKTPEGKHLLIAKGAPEAVFAHCTRFELEGEQVEIESEMMADLTEEHRRLSADGFRVLAVATRLLEPRATAYGKADEAGLSLNGYVAFLDPPKESARTAIAALSQKGIAVKVLTGDDELVARKVCKEVGLSTEHVLLGAAVEAMSDEALAKAAEPTVLFARVSPLDKERIVMALRSKGHTVGYLGDGINDAPALRAADVGISVETAVDIAKESADLILLEKSLMVLATGVTLGRKVFFNILKYVRMGASSNFGNMFSVLGASLFVPFLPMLPVQILTNNLLYDVSQATIPTDEVDDELVAKPRPWDMKRLGRFIACVGPISSVFDYVTFFVMLKVFGCADVSTPEAAARSAALFQAGWFVESLVSQTSIIHVIRTNKVPFLQSRASAPVTWMTLAVIALGIALPMSPLGRSLGFAPLPAAYWPILVGIVLTYGVLTQLVKRRLFRAGWID